MGSMLLLGLLDWFKMSKEKKGELTTAQIVALVILIVSFLIILYFLFYLRLGETSDKELCHNSVSMRANTHIPGDAVPLDCKTNYICLTKDGTCESMTNPDKKTVSTKGEVYGILANEMKDCWWMFGEGRYDYVGKDVFVSDLYCSICTQFVLDNSLDDLFGGEKISQREFYEDYLSKTKISGEDITYLEYLYGTKANFGDIFKGDYSELTFGKHNYIMMGIYSETSTKKVLGGALILGGLAVTVLSAGGLSPVGIALISTGAAALGGTVGYFVGSVTEGSSGNAFLRPTIIEANSEDFKKFECYDVKTLS